MGTIPSFTPIQFSRRTIKNWSAATPASLLALNNGDRIKITDLSSGRAVECVLNGKPQLQRQTMIVFSVQVPRNGAKGYNVESKFIPVDDVESCVQIPEIKGRRRAN